MKIFILLIALVMGVSNASSSDPQEIYLDAVTGYYIKAPPQGFVDGCYEITDTAEEESGEDKNINPIFNLEKKADGNILISDYEDNGMDNALFAVLGFLQFKGYSIVEPTANVFLRDAKSSVEALEIYGFKPADAIPASLAGPESSTLYLRKVRVRVDDGDENGAPIER